VSTHNPAFFFSLGSTLSTAFETSYITTIETTIDAADIKPIVAALF